MNILYLVPHVPGPTKARSHFHIQGLREAGHTVTIATLERNLADRQRIQQLRDSGVTVLATRISQMQSALNSLSVLPTRLPLQMAFMWSPHLMSQIRNYLKQTSPDIIHVEHLRMARYGLQLVQDWPVIWDAVDCLAPLYRQAISLGVNRPLQIISILETPRLQWYERWLTSQFPAILTISQIDQHALQNNNPYADRIHVAPLGIPIPPLPPITERSKNILVITGTLNYHPNVAAVHYFVNKIFPLVLKQKPDVQLQLVGAHPDPSIQALRSASIEITGFVPSLYEYLQRATIALAPVTYGTGTQIKVIEAFLTETPLVATSVAVRGLDIQHQEQALIADTPADFAAAILRLLDDPTLHTRIGQAGKQYAEQHHNLSQTTAQLIEQYAGIIGK
ncbi:MAG TPA: glycosyltransferase [Phototrophicaceae bacterium]|nr:glycosyltransferase [Phototrophicaceae bacterium]